ncbi:hypothetical protein BP00DRAFT_452473, partial [Aspergillus indologenus CBS 114.80]
MHHPRLADYFEDFTRPHTHTASAGAGASSSALLLASSSSTTNLASSTYSLAAAAAAAAAAANNTSVPPGTTPSYLPVEEIYVAPQFQPPNPEDEDDVVPDQHAAFGISRAMVSGFRGAGGVGGL